MPEAESSDTTYASILAEHDVDSAQRELRKRLLQEIGDADLNGGCKSVGVVAHVAHSALGAEDIPVLGDMLRKIGDVECLNLILHSGGGDGSVVEKFVALCRAQCKRFRVVIPNEAKSAATLIAIGADEIVMGPPSEIGPIDAQIEVEVHGAHRYLSAQSFIDARDSLIKKHDEQVKKGEDPQATLQMLASLDLPFISECEKLMEFGRDVAEKFLSKWMLKGKKAEIDNAVSKLSSVEKHKVHSRTISGPEARSDLNLNVLLLGQNDPFWKKIWEYYSRANIALMRGGVIKIFETEHDVLHAFRGASPT